MNLLKSSVILILAIGTVIHGLALTQVQAAVPRTPDELSNALQQIETLEAAVTVDISKASVLQAGYCEIVYGSAVLKDTTAAWDLLGRLADLDRRTGLQTVHPDLSLAAMSLYRQLKQQSEDDRYETLHEWTFPQSPQNNGLRSLIIMTPTTAPPPEFARAIGERPTRDAFPVPAAGLSAGTFSTLWLLIEAADQTGHLRTLQRELLAARNSGDPTAAFALMLLNIKAEERAANVLEEIKSRLTSTEVPTNRLPPNGRRNAEPIDVSERFLLSAAALLHRDLRADGLASLQTLSVQQKSGGLRLTRSRIQNLLLRGLSLHASAGDERVTEAEAMQMSDQFWKSASLRHWIPVTVPDATRRMPEHSAGLDRSIWLPADEQLMHLCGGDVDFLLFRYPLTGDFTFSVDGQESGPDAMASGVIWSGHAARPGANQSTGYLTLTTPDKKYETEHVCPFLVHQAASQFHRMQVMFAKGRSSLLINGQTMWTEAAVPQPSERTSDASPAGCPWIGLRSSCEVRPLFRNIRITGHPIIPGKVRLSDSHLNAWITASTTETRPTDFSPRSSGLLNLLTQPSTDWTLSGETISRRPTNNTPAQTTGSRLYHLRPLQDGERLSYQFWCDEVPCIHPTVGPLSFVLSADDVQLRWIVDSELHWTGLSPENAIRDPLAQRNRGPLPIHKKSWNDVRISLENSVVQLHLNETLVLEKELSADGNLHFGFQTFNSDSTARVRRVVLSGNWPATLSENIVQSLTETMSPLNERQQLAVERLFQDHDLAENVAQFRKKAAPLEPQQRYQVLCDWVLPSKHRPTFRLNGHFSPLSPAPSVAEFTPEEQQRIDEAEANEERCVLVGGSLFSAAFDLIDVASELGQLDQLRQLIVDSKAITSESSADMHSQRSRLALLVLIDLKAGRDQIAVESLQKFIEAVKNDPIRTPARRWPEMLVFWKAVRHPQTATLANEALFQFVYRDLHDGSGTGSQAWDRQLLALMGFRTLLETPGHHPEEYLQALPTKQWSAASFEWAMTRGQGMPGSRYMFDDHGLRQLSGHENDFLYFQSPLRGNYDIDCLTTTFDWQECEMFFNGHWAGPAWGMTHYESGDHRRSYRKQSLGPKLPNEVGRWFHVRIQSRDGIARIFANGRQLYEEPLLPDHDPWIGGRFWHRYHGAIRDVRITGNPDIPDSIRLLHDEALTGWSAYYETRNFERLENWSYSKGVLTGASATTPAQANHERLLRYHRPMLEDGSVQYEFFYQPDRFLVHPALDRLAFVLTPQAVRLHWCTDGGFDQTELPPDNLFEEPQNQIGPRPLPIRENDWNQMTISVNGNDVELKLNGVSVFRRKLEMTNMRRIGLFHFPGQTAARVRNMIWKGDWPETLPDLKDQELADVDFLEQLDAAAELMPGKVVIDFTSRRNLPDGFRINTDTAGGVASMAQFNKDGLMATQQGNNPDKWRVMAVDMPYSLSGDFDIVAAYAHFQADIPQQLDRFNGVCLRLGLDCRPAVNPFLHLRRSGNDNVFLDTMVEYGLEDGGSRWDVKAVNEESTAGKLRLARRGTFLHFLAANGDSTQFRLLRTREVPTAPVKTGSLELQTLMGGIGRTSIVWKSLTVRAEQGLQPTP